MGSIDIIKRLSTVRGSAINKSQQHHEKNYWEHQESNPGLLLGELQVCYLCAMQPPPTPQKHKNPGVSGSYFGAEAIFLFLVRSVTSRFVRRDLWRHTFESTPASGFRARAAVSGSSPRRCSTSISSGSSDAGDSIRTSRAEVRWSPRCPLLLRSRVQIPLRG